MFFVGHSHYHPATSHVYYHPTTSHTLFDNPHFYHAIIDFLIVWIPLWRMFMGLRGSLQVTTPTKYNKKPNIDLARAKSEAPFDKSTSHLTLGHIHVTLRQRLSDFREKQFDSPRVKIILHRVNSLICTSKNSNHV